MTVFTLDINELNKLMNETDPQKQELYNLLLNMLGGLKYEHLSTEEKKLLADHGYVKP